MSHEHTRCIAVLARRYHRPGSASLFGAQWFVVPQSKGSIQSQYHGGLDVPDDWLTFSWKIVCARITALGRCLRGTAFAAGVVGALDLSSSSVGFGRGRG
jgi:hypothetical protein